MYITEEATEIASHYFYKMGLNEDGIYILAEELGSDGFSNFLEDIICSYTLTEARRGREIIKPETKTGKSIGSLKGGAKTSAITRLQKVGKERRAEEESARERASRESKGFAAFSRSVTPKKPEQKQAVSTARQQQAPTPASPEKNKSALQQIAGFIGRRAGEDIRGVRQSWQSLRQAGREAEAAAAPARQALSRGAQAAAKGAVTAALFTHRAGQQARKTPTGQALVAGAAEGIRRRKAGETLPAAAGRAAAEFIKTHRRESAKQVKEDFELWVNELLDEGYDLSEYTWDDMVEIYEENISYMAEGNQLYGKLISHLIHEGYANTLDGAQAIAENMSDSWISAIIN